MPAEKIKYEDVLREGTDKLNKSIENANQAEINSNEAKQTSNMALNVAEQANQKSDNTQTQLDTMVIESGTSDAEVLQARQNERGKEFPLLYHRLNNLDKEFEQRGVNVKWFGASGSDQSTIGSISSGSNELTVVDAIDFEIGQGILIEGAGPGGVAEVAELQITSPPTIAGQVVITLDGIATNVDVDPSVETTAIAIADKIRNTSFAGWTVGGTAGTDIVTFTSNTVGTKQNATFNDNGTGGSGVMSTTTEGQDGGNLITRITAINGTVFTLADSASADATNVNVMHDDSIAIQSAIASSFGSDIFFPQGIYLASNSITATITNNKRFLSSSKVIIKYTGNSNSHMMSIDLSGNDIEFSGDITFDGDNKASRGILIDNITSDMSDAVKFVTNDLKLMNFYSETEGVGSLGMRIKGGFNIVEFNRLTCENISRAQGVGIPFSQGSIGVQVTHDSTTSYSNQVVFNSPIIKNVSSEELDGDPNNLDCDGISIFAPNDPSVSNTILRVNGGEFIDCRGRSIKSQMGNLHVIGTSFIRQGVRSINNGCEIDVQRGLGYIKDISCRFYDLPDATSSLGDSYTVVTGNHTRSEYKGNLIVQDVQIIANTTDYQFYFCVFNASQQMSIIRISGVSLLSGFDANLHSLLRCDVSKIDNIIIENNSINRVINGIVSDVSPSGTTITSKVILKNNFQYHGTQPNLIHNKQNSYANGNFIIENNIGFVTPSEYQDEIFFGVKENAQINTRAVRLTTSGVYMGPTGQLGGGQWDLVGDNQNYGVKIFMVRENFNPQGVYAVMPVGSGIVDIGTNTLYIHMGNGVWGNVNLTVPS